MKKSFFLLLVTILVLVTCARDEDTAPTPVNTPAALKEIKISESTLGLKIGDSHQFKVTHSPTSISAPTYTWESSNPEIATISSTGLLTGVKNGQVTITVSANDKKFTSTCKVTVSAVDVQSVALEAESMEILIEESKKINYTITPENATNKNVTWSTSDSTIVSVDSTGTIKGIAVGEAKVSLKTSNNLSSTVAIKVNPIKGNKITLNKTTTTLLIGSKEKLTATIEPANTTDKDIIWTSSDESIATVSTEGEILAKAVGECIINARTKDGLTATCVVKVDPIATTSITLNKTTLTLNIGGEEQLTAKVLPENATDKKIIWTSSNENIATVNSTGKVSAKNIGQCTINARTADGKMASCIVTVAAIEVTKIALSPTDISIEVGENAQLLATIYPSNATNKEIIWTSSDESIASISTSGLISGINPGTTKIYARTPSGIQASSSVTVKEIIPQQIKLSHTTLSIEEGEYFQLQATLIPTNTTNKTINWSSSNSQVATVKDGQIYAVGKGQAIIKATSWDGKINSSCAVTVTTESIEMQYKSLQLIETHNHLITAIKIRSRELYTEGTWTSSNEKVAKVQPKMGSNEMEIIAVGPGNAQILVKMPDGRSASCDVYVESVYDYIGIELKPSETSIFAGHNYISFQPVLRITNNLPSNITVTKMMIIDNERRSHTAPLPAMELSSNWWLWWPAFPQFTIYGNYDTYQTEFKKFIGVVDFTYNEKQFSLATNGNPFQTITLNAKSPTRGKVAPIKILKK